MSTRPAQSEASDHPEAVEPRDADPSAKSDSPSHGDARADGHRISAERIRQIHAACLLLGVESKPEKATTKKLSGHPGRLPSNVFARAILALAVSCLAALLGYYVIRTRPETRRVADYRWDIDYTNYETGDVQQDGTGRRLLVATLGGGLHTIDMQTRFLKQFTAENTSGGLMSDDIHRIAVDESGRPYFLCRRDGNFGLCRATIDLKSWETLVGFGVFPALDTESPLAEISAVTEHQDMIWVASRTGGVGGYSVRTHEWNPVLTTQNTAGRLLSDQVRDLVVDDTGLLWIATAGGINRFDPATGTCTAYTEEQGLAGSDISRLAAAEGMLWYTTSNGGLGRYDGSEWSVLAPESGWSGHSASDVVLATQDPSGAGAFLFGSDGGVVQYSPRQRKWQPLNDLPNGRPALAAAVTAGNSPLLWVGTSEGLWQRTLAATEADSEWTSVVAGRIDLLDSHGKFTAIRRTPQADARPTIEATVDGTEWRTAGGGLGAAVGPNGALAVAPVPKSKLLWVGTEAGIFQYDPREHTWPQRFLTSVADAPAGAVTEIQRVEAGPVVATSEHEMARLDEATGAWSSLFGGGRFPANQADITAVTRDSQGQLWVGTRTAGLHRYDPRYGRWTAVSGLNGVTQLTASKDRVWIVNDQGIVRMAEANGLPQAVKGLADIEHIAASPDVSEVVALRASGEVYLVTAAGDSRVLIGTAATQFDPNAATTVGVLGSLVVFGGASPHIYNTTEHAWSRILDGRTGNNVGQVDQIVSSLGSLWLRAGAKLFRLEANGRLSESSVNPPATQLAATADRLFALSEGDHSIRIRTQGDGNWQSVKVAAAGPDPAILTGAPCTAAAHGADLYLAGTEQGRGWHFSWTDQEWKPLTKQQQPLAGIIRLASTAQRIYALTSGSRLFSARVGSADLQPDTSNVRSIETTPARATVTTTDGSVLIIENQLRQVAAGTRPETKTSLGELRQVAKATDGFVIAGQLGTAWLSDGLSRWQTINAPNDPQFKISELISGERGKNIWALDANSRLYQWERNRNIWSPVRFPSNSPVRSAIVVPDAQRPGAEELWATLQDGSIQVVDSDRISTFSRSTGTGYADNTIQGITRTSDGLLVAFRDGLSVFELPARRWRKETSPSRTSIVELVNVGDAATAFCLLRCTDGTLWRASQSEPLNWERVALNTESVAAAGDQAFAIAEQPRRLIRISASGIAERLISPNQAPGRSAGRIIAAAEIERAQGQPILLLVYGTSVAAYDPDARTWQELPFAAAATKDPSRDETVAWPVQSGVVMRRTDQTLHLLEWRDGLRLSPLGAEPVVVAATRPTDRTMITVNRQGKVSVVAAGKPIRSLIGSPLNADFADTRITVSDIRGLNSGLFLTDSKQRLHSYNEVTRAWQQLSDFDSVHRIKTHGDSLIVDADSKQDKRRQLFRMTNQGGQFNIEILQQDLLAWDVTPVGIVTLSGARNDPKRTIIPDDRANIPEWKEAGTGPPEESVVGIRTIGDDIWFRTNTDGLSKLWHYDITSRLWQPMFEADDNADRVRIEKKRISILTSDGTLKLAERKAEGAWNQQIIAQNVVDFDLHGDTLAWATPDELSLITLSDRALKRAAQTAELRSICLFEDGVFVATEEGLEKFSTDLVKADALLVRGRCDVLAASDRKAFYIRGSDGVVSRFDGKQSSLPRQTWDQLTAALNVSSRDAATPVSVSVPVGADGSVSENVSYSGKRLAIDSPIPLKGDLPNTTFDDAGRSITLTDAGLIVRSQSGRPLALHRVPGADGLCWVRDRDGRPVLLIRSAKGSGWQLKGDETREFENFRTARRSSFQRWINQPFRWGLTDGGRSVVLERPDRETLAVLSLTAGRFLRDTVEHVALDERSAWLIGPGGTERWELLNKGGGSERHPNISDISVKRLGRRLLLKTGSGEFTHELNANGTVGRVQLNELEKAAANRLHDGTRWRVDGGSDNTFPVVSFRIADGGWLKSSLSANSGFRWDQLIAVGATSDRVVLQTRAGDLTFPSDPDQKRVPIGSLTPVALPAGTTSDAATFRNDDKGILWRSSAKNVWSRFDPATFTWLGPGNVFPAQRPVQININKTVSARWHEGDKVLELRELDADQNAVSSRLRNGRFDFTHALAVLPFDQTVWIVTGQDMRHLDRTTRRLIGTHKRPDTTSGNLRFRKQDDRWFMRVGRSAAEQADDVRELSNGLWDTASSQNPFQSPPPLTGQHIRFRNGENSVTTEIRTGPGAADWQKAEFDQNYNRFDFQVAMHAATTGQSLLVESKPGISVWRQNGADWDLEQFVPNYTSLRVTASRHVLAGIKQEQTIVEFREGSGWERTQAGSHDFDLIALSTTSVPMWKVSRQSGVARIKATPEASPEVTLSLSPEGGFEFQRPSVIAALEDGTLWTGSQGSRVRYPAGRSNPDVVGTESGKSLFAVDDAVYVGNAQQLMTHQKQDGWRAIPDPQQVFQQKAVLHDGPDWRWEQSPQGGLRGERKAVDGTTLAAEFDSRLGRFHFDTISDAGVRPDRIWLSHGSGFSLTDVNTSRLLRSFPQSAGQPIRYDRVGSRLLLGSADALFFRLAADAAEQLTDTNGAAQVFERMYADSQWQFSAGEIHWMGLETGLSDGVFDHDDIRSFVIADDHVFASTPAATRTWQLTDDELTALPLSESPANSPAWLQAENNQLLALTETGALFQAAIRTDQPTVLQWKAVANRPQQLTLVQDGNWTWTRQPDGQIRVELGLEGRPALSPVLTENGHFPFDDVTTFRTTADGLMTAGPAGIALQKYNDGALLKWSPTAIADGKEVTLPPVSEFRCIGPDSWPIASWVESPKQATTLAVCEDGTHWKLTRNDDLSEWQWSELDMAAQESGQPVLLAGPLAVHRRDGQLRMSYHGTTSSQPTLVDGRLTIDVIADVQPHGDSLWYATAGGILQSREDDDTTRIAQRLSATTSDNFSLTGVRRLYEHADSGELWARDANERLFRLDERQSTWHSESDVAGKEAGDVAVASDFWTWYRNGSVFRIALHNSDEEEGSPLFHNGRFAFDVIYGICSHQSSLFTISEGGLVQFHPETMELQKIYRHGINAKDGSPVSLSEVRRFARDNSLTCFSDNHTFRFDKNEWQRTQGQEQIGKYVWQSGATRWQVTALGEQSGYGFDIELKDSQGHRLRQYTVLSGKSDAQLRRIIAEPDKLWICLDRGIHFLRRD